MRRNRFRVILAISNMVKRNIVQHYGVAPEKIAVIYNGVDLDRFNPRNREIYRRATRERHGLTEEDVVILFVGSGFERKGVKFLLRAVESVRHPVSVMIVGKGTVKGEPGQHRQKIILCGPRKDIERYYAAADIFVFPTMYEPFGNVHLEALASGLPVITTRNSGASEIIEDGEQGFIIDRPEDVSVLSDRINCLLNNRGKLAAMGIHARKRAEEFSYDHHIKKVSQLYEYIINE